MEELKQQHQSCQPAASAGLGAPLRGHVEQLLPGRRFAFVRLDNGRGVYAHRSAFRGVRFTELRPDQPVDCWLETAAAGLQAIQVRPCRRSRTYKRLTRLENAGDE